MIASLQGGQIINEVASDFSISTKLRYKFSNSYFIFQSKISNSTSKRFRTQYGLSSTPQTIWMFSQVLRNCLCFRHFFTFASNNGAIWSLFLQFYLPLFGGSVPQCSGDQLAEFIQAVSKFVKKPENYWFLTSLIRSWGEIIKRGSITLMILMFFIQWHKGIIFDENY